MHTGSHVQGVTKRQVFLHFSFLMEHSHSELKVQGDSRDPPNLSDLHHSNRPRMTLLHVSWWDPVNSPNIRDGGTGKARSVYC